MHTEYLIIGQGIAGTMLSYALEQQGLSFIVIDPGDPYNASRVAGAVINPASGKNWSPARDQAILIPEAVATYQAIAAQLEETIIHTSQLTVTHTDDTAQESFEQKVTAGAPFLSLDHNDTEQFFNSPHGFGCIQPVYRIAAKRLLDGWRHYLDQSGRLRNTTFRQELCTIGTNSIQYEDIIASRLIFCEGAAGRYNPLFRAQPFTANRGEALLLSIPELPETAVYQGKIRLIPEGNGLFWCGSNYRWDFDNLQPDQAWRDQTLQQLRLWLRLPFSLEDHIVAERPTTAGQVQLSIQHPVYPDVYLFNGLGTRGFSAAPYLSRQLVQQIKG